MGTVLREKYRIERVLGVGGTASVYEAVHERNGYRVAVKILHPTLAKTQEIRDRFLREGRVANRVGHVGATCVLDDDITEDGSAYLVMDLLEGETLEEHGLYSASPISHPDIAGLAYQLLDTLAAAHERGIVHRDIKPENLFLTRAGVLKVLDFGIAHLQPTGIAESVATTRAGVILGTPAYLPPEQALGKTNEVDGRTDIWAVGATMFWLLSGRYVHGAETLDELLRLSGCQSARPLASVATGIPLALASVVDRALSFEVADRWPTARAMQAALESAYPNPAERGARPWTAPSPYASDVAVAPASGALAIVPHVGSTLTRALLNESFASSAGKTSRPCGIYRRRAGLVLGAFFLATLLGGRLAISRVDRALSLSPDPSPVNLAGDGWEPHLDLRLPPLSFPVDDTTSLSVDALPKAIVAAGAASHAVRVRRPVPSCDPPFDVDAIGRRLPKPECL